ncbi:phenylalanine-tRNA ligase [Pandoraea thiooxydans]|uniref:B3/B4 tRNA-binding domain-containing protein n=1 Tax=Pandoraea thiooxydans TaxID=445709 RepID=A0A0G3EQW9_9BURK|nr:phenylalanine--tRNA ligase beta subunit-related protein [Pandoraea thiooxydans]AKJ67101.1 hypothetical protein ABW99_01520 [Pandoraea thiooxydans]APR94051.1 phenylalanine-tRNA ligase [Pandoraea thiooxydans]
MQFSHANAIWYDYPALTPGVLFAEGVPGDGRAVSGLAHFYALAGARLAAGTEADLPEIQAWRRAFSSMGLKPTQYRCASESLLRRFRKEGALATIHPLIDLCNAVSIAFATPIAVFDTGRIAGGLTVRYAEGNEPYLAFSGEQEYPEPGEVIFADGEGLAHARRWTHRQSVRSAVRADTTAVLIVAEGLHASAGIDVLQIITAVREGLDGLGWQTRKSAVLSQVRPTFEF